MKIFAALALALVLITSGCGYHTSGSVNHLPTLQTIAIPTFTNKTHAYRIEQILTTAVVREMTTRTQYRIVNQESADADATLKGVVTQTQTAPVTYDSVTGRASTSLVTVTMSVSLVDRNGKVIFSNPNYVFRDEYQISRELSSFIDEEAPAVDRLSRDFARSLVSNVLEGF